MISSLSRLARTTVLAAAATGTLLSGVALTAETASAAPQVYNVSSAAALEQLTPNLSAGDTVALASGTYNLGAWRPRLVIFGKNAVGTATAPITITAADPAHPPLLTGALKFDGLKYWTFSHLRFQGTVANTPTLTFDGGNNWSLLNSEVFGASKTGALANIAVARLPAFGMPTNWTISGNSVHDAGANPKQPGGQHEIYLTAVGNAVNGQITHNRFYNTSQGATVKIGNGGEVNSPGISGVHVDDNTMYNNFEQVLIHGNVSDNTVRGNLMIKSTRAMGNGWTVGVYLAGVTGHNNLIQNNYFFGVGKPIYNNHSTGFINGGGNSLGVNPRLNGAFRPTVAKAQAFGAYS